jgi:hypothetical protein
MKLRVLYHGHCFDGVASAAVFTRFYREKVRGDADVDYAALVHRQGALFDEEMFDGDENAVVDFKYSASPRLTWWFDHHLSAFLTAEDEAHFRRDRSGRKFLDTASKSCAELIARVAAGRFGFRDPALDPLVGWARTIDGGLYRSAAEPVEMREPALQLMLVIDNEPDEAFSARVIRGLSERPLDDVALSREVQGRFNSLFPGHLRAVEIIGRRARHARGVVHFDLVEDGVEVYNKFIPYHLFPDASYTVAVTRTPARTKISVGSNPFSPRPRRHNIATICERYGGGGHAVVGAISLGPGEIEAAREVAREVVEELSRE